MTQSFVALGSNLGPRAEHLARAVAGLGRLPRTRVVAVSAWIETEPVGGPPGQGAYLNGAVELDTGLGARELLGELQRLEAAAGRARNPVERDGPRTLDLDLLLHGDERSSEPGLRVPHPRLEERLFVLRPLQAIAPGLVLPSGTPIGARVDALAARERESAAGASRGASA